MLSITGMQAGDANPFTVVDDIGLGIFGDNSFSGQVQQFVWSPDRKMVVAHVGRGLVTDGRVESEIRIYRRSDITQALSHGNGGNAVRPIFTLKMATASEGPIIKQLKWSRDSTGLAFLSRDTSGRSQLRYVSLPSGEVSSLTPPDQDVAGYDLVDKQKFVVGIREVPEPHPLQVGPLTGRPLLGLIYSPAAPGDDNAVDRQIFDRSAVWRSGSGNLEPVADPDGHPMIIFREGLDTLSLSPDGNHLLAAEAVGSVPEVWRERLPKGTPPMQDIAASRSSNIVSRYVVRDLQNGHSQIVGSGPTGRSTGWFTSVPAAWSQDSQTILLSSVAERSAAPCLAKFDLNGGKTACVGTLVRDPNLTAGIGARQLTALFIPSKSKVCISVQSPRPQRTCYHQGSPGNWRANRVDQKPEPVEVEVRQSVDKPPVLIAKSAGTRQIVELWNPNPQIDKSKLAPVRAFETTTTLREHVIGGLYLPIDYTPGRKYPLVIQTHGYDPQAFVPSGIYPTAFAARELASGGIMVLQLKDCPRAEKSDEGDCQVRYYRAAINELSAQGIVDNKRIGIVGFSRTCYYILSALTSDLSIVAASITDGIDAGYWQYLMNVDDNQNLLAADTRGLVSADPWGAGLQTWLARSPTFNTDRIRAPLQIVATNYYTMMNMWEPYALLRYQRKPVDLTILGTTEHVLTNPRARILSQTGTVDWMRFWLQGFEDPDPAKAMQYRRWERICELQRASVPADAAFCPRTEPTSAVETR